MIEKISENLFNLRRSVGKTQKEVAKEVGISAVTLSAYENGQKEPLLSYAAKLAKYYGVTLDSLCGIDRTERKEVTASDVLQTISTLNEYPLFVEMKAGWNREFNVDYPYSEANIRIIDSGKWLTEYIQNYNKICELIRDAGLDAEVLEAWKKSKYQEMMCIRLSEEEPEQSTDEE